MAYIFGALSHLAVGIIFLALKVYEMVWFNFMFSVPVFVFSFYMNRKGRHGLAFSLAFIELLVHQAAGVYYIGWDSGLQYFLIYLAGLTFFNAYWKKTVRLGLITVITATFLMLYLFFKIPKVCVLSESDGSMWQSKEFADFMNNIKPDGQSRLDRLYRHAGNIGNQDNLEDDFTIVEVAFG